MSNQPHDFSYHPPEDEKNNKYGIGTVTVQFLLNKNLISIDTSPYFRKEIDAMLPPGMINMTEFGKGFRQLLPQSAFTPLGSVAMPADQKA
jgi:hypothetical protein